MPAKTTLVRVSEATKALLDAEINRLVKARDAGRTEAVPLSESNNPHDKGMTVDALIRRLLDLDARKRQRSAQSAARKRQRTAAARTEGGAS